jgi:hypothetical protein
MFPKQCRHSNEAGSEVCGDAVPVQTMDSDRSSRGGVVRVHPHSLEAVSEAVRGPSND